MKKVVIPILVILSSVVMAMAWLVHLRFEDTWTFWMALGFSWMLVLPEYALNTVATRWGYDTYSGAQMASIHLSAGVVFVALVSMVVLEETPEPAHFLGFMVMLLAIMLIFNGDRDAAAEDPEQADEGAEESAP